MIDAIEGILMVGALYLIFLALAGISAHLTGRRAFVSQADLALLLIAMVVVAAWRGDL